MKPDMNNPYDAHAVFALGFVCDRCGKKLTILDRAGEPIYSDAWYLRLARTAESEGWFVPHEEDDGKLHIMFCLCRDCTKFKDEELKNTHWEKL